MIDKTDRFWSKANILGDDACWEWTSFVDSDGYGRYQLSKRVNDRSHREAFRRVHGPIPEGMMVRHKCDNRRCVNPAHLEPGTHWDNMRDRKERGRNSPRTGSCNGRHKLTDDQVRYIRSQQGKRMQKDLAAELGVTQASISGIQLGRTWTHVK